MRKLFHRDNVAWWNVLIVATLTLSILALMWVSPRTGIADLVNPPHDHPVPRILPYRGYVYVDNALAADASKDITFNLYSTLIDGTALWTETHQAVAIAQGQFNVLLGSVTPFNNAAITASALYLEVQLGSNLTLAPRHQITQPSALGAVAHGYPTGVIITYAGTAAPPGWLACDGSPLSKSQFPRLYAAIGDVHGVASSHNQFLLPDLRGMFLRGWDGGSGRYLGVASRTSASRPDIIQTGVGSVQGFSTSQGSTPLVLTTESIHHHGYVDVYYSEHSGDDGDCTVGGNTQYGSSGSDWDNSWCTRSVDSDDAGVHTHVLSSGDRESRPKNVAMMYLIKF